jgi:hypothetical protein
VLGYLHTEVIPSFAVGSADRRINAIDAIAVFEVRVLNGRRARLAARTDPPGKVKLFGPFLAFNGGKAMPPSSEDDITRFGAFVGIQDQATNPRHAYPGDWFSFVGPCPLSPWTTDELNRGEKPSPCDTTPALEGICDRAAPDGTRLCQYTYTYLGYVPLDDLVGITSKSTPLCRTGDKPRACVNYADFRQDGGVEYSSGPNPGMPCARDQAPESGLAFWRGRCDARMARARIRALETWPRLLHPPGF